MVCSGTFKTAGHGTRASESVEMIATASRVVVMIFGIAICALSLWGMYAPLKLVQLVRGVMDRDSGIYAAVGARIVMGLVLLVTAEGSRFPRAFQVLGWIAILAAAFLAVIGREGMRKFVGWFDRLSPALIRLWLVFGMAFGAFLIYGVA